MNLLSRRAMLGILFVLDTALSGEKPLSAKVFASRHHLPPRYLETMLQRFVHAGILKGIRGPLGGYTLGKARDSIALAEISNIVESLSVADPEDYTSGSPLFAKVVEPRLCKASEPFFINLRKITIDDLFARAKALGIDGRDAMDSIYQSAGSATMTLDEMRAQGIRAVTTHCVVCGHETDFPVDPLDGDLLVAEVGRKMRCIACGGKQIETRPGPSVKQ